jgi:large-conductance mechanosensitive channel
LVSGFITLFIAFSIISFIIFLMFHSIIKASFSNPEKHFVSQVGDEDGELFYVTTPDGGVRID